MNPTEDELRQHCRLLSLRCEDMENEFARLSGQEIMLDRALGRINELKAEVALAKRQATEAALRWADENRNLWITGNALVEHGLSELLGEKE